MTGAMLAAEAHSPAATAASTEKPVLAIDDLKTWFYTRDGIVRAVDGVSYAVGRGETLGVVGESGCGKSVTALSVMGLVPNPPGRIVGGSIRLADRELVGLDETSMRAVRGNEISMIFQEPMTSLNPAFTIGRQITDALHRLRDDAEIVRDEDDRGA